MFGWLRPSLISIIPIKFIQHDLSKKGDSDKMKNDSDAGKDSSQQSSHAFS